MGTNSSDALAAFMKEYLARCTVVDGKIIPPTEYDVTAGGHRLLDDPKPRSANPDDPYGPDWKRGQ